MLIVLVDDDRDFIIPRPATVLRTSAAALAELRRIHDDGEVVDELWLDHDLGGDDTAMPVVDMLSELAFNDDPFPVRRVYVHSMNNVGAERMMRSLQNYGYPAIRVKAREHVMVKEEKA